MTGNAQAAAAATLLVGLVVNLEAAARQPIDAERSTITVHVGKAGVFRAFADNHEIRGPVKDGWVDEDARAVEIIVDARELRVLDPNLSPKDREEVQSRMFGPDVLSVSSFPEIRFAANAADKTTSGWVVRGELTVRGQTRRIAAAVTQQDGHYRGTVRLKQTEFGITPITVAGGAVKVKDELTIDFDIVTRPGAATGR